MPKTLKRMIIISFDITSETRYVSSRENETAKGMKEIVKKPEKAQFIFTSKKFMDGCFSIQVEMKFNQNRLTNFLCDTIDFIFWPKFSRTLLNLICHSFEV
jgi:hypothetical protein